MPRVEGGVIARELQFGNLAGTFRVECNGTVMYHSPCGGASLYAAPSANSFLEAADCWGRYCEHVAQAGSEGARLAAVGELREHLTRLGLLGNENASVWSAYLEQAE